MRSVTVGLVTPLLLAAGVACAAAAGLACAAAAGTQAPRPTAGEEATAMQPQEKPKVKLDDKLADPAVARERAIERATEHLAEKLGIPVSEVDNAIEVVSAKAVTWPNSALGCPEPDMMYAQILVEGHAVVLEAKGEKHELHVGPKAVVECMRK